MPVKRKKSRSVLKKQKLKKRRSPFHNNLHKILPYILGFGLFAGIIYLVTPLLTDWLERPVGWEVSLRIDGSEPLKKNIAEQVIAITQRNTKSGSRNEMLNTASLIQKIGSFSSVNVSRVSRQHIVVSIRERTGVLCIKTDRLRLVSRDAKIYGTATEKNCPGPIFSKLLDNKKLLLKNDHTYRVASETEEIIAESVELHILAKGSPITISALEFDKFRGFIAKVDTGNEEKKKTPSMTVYFGRSPFDLRFRRLNNLLAEIQAKGEIASRIELDYHGKAFIKIRKNAKKL